MSRQAILICEDEPIVALDIERSLHMWGFAVIGPASEGEVAIQLARQHKPNLVIMDVVLRGQQRGTEAGKYISNVLDIPVIYLTAHTDEATIEEARASNPFGFVVKPFEPKALCISVDFALAQHQRSRSMSEKQVVNARWQQVLHHLPHAVLALDMFGRILCMNRPAEELLGQSEEECVGLPWQRVFAMHDTIGKASFSPSLSDSVQGSTSMELRGTGVLEAHAGLDYVVEWGVSRNDAPVGGCIACIVTFVEKLSVSSKREWESTPERL